MKNVLILGASSDTGRALALKFAKEGYNLIVTARDKSVLERDVKDLSIRYDIDVKNIDFDISTPSTHKDFFNTLEPKPEIVISTIGYLGEQEKAQEEFEEAEKIVWANYLGNISILEIFAKHFQEQKEGIIIGISSVAGDRGRKANYIYGSAKAGFTAYLSGLRNRLNDFNVHVLTVKPGFMNTKMTQGMDLPKKLTIEPVEAADMIYKAFRKKKNIVYIKPVWALVMLIIIHIPEFIFKKLSI